jgi:hypothetical protein
MEDKEAQSEGIVKEKSDRQKESSILGICKLTAACTVKYNTVPASILDQIYHHIYIYLGSSVCHIPVCRSCGTLSYSLCFTHHIDQGDKTEGFKKEGLEMER